MRRESEVAFEEFVAAAAPRLLRTAFLLTGDRGHAEDLLQTTFERTARRWTKISGEPEAYARTVLANLATDRWRRRAARPAEVYGNLPDPAGGDIASDLVTRSSLVAALGELTRRQRTVLVLRYFDDLTEAETAQALGITVGTVKSTANRALARLRELAGVHDLMHTSS